MRNYYTALFVAVAMHSFAQPGILVSPSADCLTCDGTVSLEFDPNFFDAYITDANGVPTFLSGNGNSVVFENLCPGLYQFGIEIGVEFYQGSFSVGIPGAEGGISSQSLCTSGAPFDLQDLWPGLPAGGQWYDPNNAVFSGTVDPETDLPGLYVYQIDAGCPIYWGVDIVLFEPANPGNTTTYLICETYEAFELFDALFGNPEPNGEWFGPGNVPDDGWYDPETDQTSLFVYRIDTVPACPPVFNTLFVVENQLPDPGLPVEITICPGSLPFEMTEMLGGTPDDNGLWYNQLNQPVGPVFDPETMLPGTYEYRVLGLTPCPTLESSLTIIFGEGISAGTGGNEVVCSVIENFDLAEALAGNPDPGGVWTSEDGQVVPEILDLSVYGSGTYTYTVSAQGCQDESADVELFVEYFPLAGPDSEWEFCGNQNLDLNALLSDEATSGGLWSVAGGIIEDPVQSITAGISAVYTYAVVGLACPDDEALITVVAGIQPEAGEDEFVDVCYTLNALDLNSVVSEQNGVTGVWMDDNQNAVDPVFQIPGEGVYVLYYVASANGGICPNDTLQVTIDVQTSSFEAFSDEIILCSSDALFFPGNYIPADYPDNGDWYFNGEYLPVPVVDPDAIPQGEFVYTLPVQGVCPNSPIVLDVITYEEPEAGFGGQIIRCLNAEPLVLPELPSQNAMPGGSWSFNGAALLSDTFVPTQNGTLVYTVEGMGTCPFDIAQWTIEILPLPVYEAGEDIHACSGSLPVVLGTGGDEDYFYSWSPPDRLDNAGSPNPVLNLENPDNDQEYIQYVVAISDGNCQTTDTLEVDILPLPEPILESDAVICEGDTVELTVSGGESYVWPLFAWLNPEGTTALAAPSESSWVEVIAYNSYGCEARDSVFIQVLSSPLVSVEWQPQSGCPPLTVQFVNSSDNGDETFYYWQASDGQLSLDGEFVFTDPGTYGLTLYASFPNGCLSSWNGDALVEVFPSPQAEFGWNPEEPGIYTQEIQFINFSEGADFWNWEVGAFFSDDWEPVFSVADLGAGSTQACLFLTNIYGCSDSLCRMLEIEEDQNIYVPNAFSPNDDGRNEGFVPVFSGENWSKYHLQIFDRWGLLLFESADSSESWKGNYLESAELVPPDLYVWQLRVRNTLSGDDILKRGHVTVVR